MASANRSRWGIVSVAILMLFVTMVNASINGNKNSLYYAVWIFVAWWGYKGNLEQIRDWMKYLIWLNVALLLLLFLFFDEQTVGYATRGGNKQSMLFGVLVMLAPKVLLYLWCKKIINEKNKNFDTLIESVKVEDKEIPKNNEAYLHALNEYETEQRDRALYAKLYAENEGDENLVKAKYIKIKAEKKIALEKSQKQNTVSKEIKENTSVRVAYQNVEGTIFQKLLQELGFPKWVESTLIIFLLALMMYLLFNFTSFFY